MTRIIKSSHAAEPLLTPRTRVFKPLQTSPAMRAVQARRTTPTQVSMASAVPLNQEVGRVHDRIDNWRRKA